MEEGFQGQGRRQQDAPERGCARLTGRLRGSYLPQASLGGSGELAMADGRVIIWRVAGAAAVASGNAWRV